MFHLIGDVHQPLHTAKLVTDQFPEPDGDRGGSKFYVRVSLESSPITLHNFWDGLVIGSGKFENVRKRATALMNKPGLKREDFAADLTVRSFKDWAVASYHLAAKRAYVTETLQGGADRNQRVMLSGDYTDQAKAVAERQVVLSGYRISDAMVDVFGR